jgi:hypothetical protein
VAYVLVNEEDENEDKDPSKENDLNSEENGKEFDVS